MKLRRIFLVCLALLATFHFPSYAKKSDKVEFINISDIILSKKYSAHLSKIISGKQAEIEEIQKKVKSIDEKIGKNPNDKKLKEKLNKLVLEYNKIRESVMVKSEALKAKVTSNILRIARDRSNKSGVIAVVVCMSNMEPVVMFEGKDYKGKSKGFDNKKLQKVLESVKMSDVKLSGDEILALKKGLKGIL